MSDSPMLSVTFQSRGRTRRQQRVLFDLGDEKANSLAALEHAWKNDSRIIESADLCPDPDCRGEVDGDGFCSNLCGSWE